MMKPKLITVSGGEFTENVKFEEIINSLAVFGIKNKLAHKPAEEKFDEKVAIIGAGPAGLHQRLAAVGRPIRHFGQAGSG